MPPREKEFDAVCLVIDVGDTSAASGFLNSAIKYSTVILTVISLDSRCYLHLALFMSRT